MEVTTFTCSICGEASHKICVYCTKDACGNHLCERCFRCSDCCQCDMRRFVNGEAERVEIIDERPDETEQFEEAEETAPVEA